MALGALALTLTLGLPLATACAPAGARTDAGTDGTGRAPTPAPATASPEMLAAAARADSVRAYYSPDDVAFMTAMLHHHAQALVMARMAPTHGASPSLRTLAARIINSQKDEMALMIQWLRDRNEPVPDLDPSANAGPLAGDHAGHHPARHAHHDAPGETAATDHAAMAGMAGMLTPEQLRRLDEARGAEWDRLFLTYMIQHHQGAVIMVDELFATHGAGQGDAIFKIAADIGADQASEIDRMQRMLRDLIFAAEDMP
jgi:uncharacterized protein (DUF305 family)